MLSCFLVCHQVTQHDVEDRLYKNTEVYNAIRADVETPAIKNLTNALEERIGMDKVRSLSLER